MNAEELAKFLDTFKPIYEVLFYLEAKPEYAQLCQEIEEELVSTLKGLNDQCLEYIRMTTRLFLEESKGETIFERLLVGEMHLPLFEVMKVDAPFRYEFACLYLQVKERDREMAKLGELANQMVSDEEVISKLSGIGKYFPEKLAAYVRVAEEQF